MLGRFYGIGVGPGDPALLTRRAVALLETTPVIFTPRGKGGGEGVALTIIRDILPESAEIVPLHLPMIQDDRLLRDAWEEAARQIYDRLAAGKDAAFVTIGDCLLFSTYGYLLKALREIDPDLSVESVPGVTSFSASASRLNLPLAEGEEPLLVVPALRDPEELRPLLRQFPNLVLMKVASRFDEIYRVLQEEGRAESAAFVARCGTPEERIVCDLASLVGQKLDYLSLLIVKPKGVSI
ncbi:precorrin-2 C(20)-methyltransferase [Heliobacterium undosum]|uniref:Precorrin-2 C(20)-methyltransferase n=1 Tax=Heliomicrobium undosum TaxID=121734 RepID=A0A845KXW5_9FIRM|nr:precorrin-2 C(20)-methyltransferase [Heliomicrobium undosum]MZP28532.1 precorrin-2 C(20)-methyltransferase [Heliomicrobium undosum]